jgi:hypothetical protein
MCSAKHPTKTTASCEKLRQVGMHWNLDKARPVDFTGFKRWGFNMFKAPTMNIIPKNWCYPQNGLSLDSKVEKKKSRKKPKIFSFSDESFENCQWIYGWWMKSFNFVADIPMFIQRHPSVGSQAAIFSRSWTPNITWNHQFWVKS